MERQSDDMGAVKGTGNTALHSSDAWHSVRTVIGSKVTEEDYG